MDVVEVNAKIMVGVPVRAHWKALWEKMPNAWRTFMERSGEIDDRVGEAFWDVSLARNGEEYLQLVCAEVAHRPARVPAGMLAVEIPAQSCIRHIHHGPPEGIADAFGAMYVWADGQGVAADEFKLDYGYMPRGDESQHALYVGLVPRTPWRELASG